MSFNQSVSEIPATNSNLWIPNVVWKLWSIWQMKNLVCNYICDLKILTHRLSMVVCQKSSPSKWPWVLIKNQSHHECRKSMWIRKPFYWTWKSILISMCGFTKPTLILQIYKKYILLLFEYYLILTLREGMYTFKNFVFFNVLINCSSI